MKNDNKMFSAKKNQDARKRCWMREWNEKWPKHQRKNVIKQKNE